jgi:diguanylate cyclase (GGDEF)-like protein
MSGQAPYRPSRRLGFLREVGWSAAVLIATVVAMAVLTTLSWFTISATSRAGDRVRTASQAADAYLRTRDALEALQSVELAAVVTPNPRHVQALRRAGARLDGSLAGLSASASARHVRASAPEWIAIASLVRDDGVLEKAVNGVTAAVRQRNLEKIFAIDAHAVNPTIKRMLLVVKREAGIHQHDELTGLATSQTTEDRTSVALVLTLVLCVALISAVVHMLRLRRRLAAAAGREIARLSDAALRDSLTSLRNHRCFQEDIRRSLEHDSAVHALLVDMDGLKRVNDKLGHQIGDERICQLATALADSCSGVDARAYRIGGDEFAIIAAGRVGRPERIADALHAELRAQGGVVTATVGIATAAPGMEADELLRRADKALILAKPMGSGTRIYSRALESAPSSAEGERAELVAIIDDPAAIVPVFQPIVDLRTGEVVGHEALSRFPDAGWRTPQEWFDLAHAHDLAIEFEAAAVRAALHAPERPALPFVNLNISPKVLLSARDRIGLPDDLSTITIEVTEDELVTEGRDLEIALHELRARGARIAIDDAGAGYAGLKQVMWVRPDIVKLDMELTRAIHADPVRMALVESLVRFARRVGAIVCAEGIESLDDIEVLANLDVPWGQGYAIGRPSAPWGQIASPAAQTCRDALARVLAASPEVGPPAILAGDRRLEHLSRRLANARSSHDLYSALDLIAGELHADKISLSQWRPERGGVVTLAESGTQPAEEFFPVTEYPATGSVISNQEAIQILVGDPRADQAEVKLLVQQGFRSLLMVPVILRGESLGMVEAMAAEERSWTRTEINRARIIANQLASVIQSFAKAPERERL